MLSKFSLKAKMLLAFSSVSIIFVVVGDSGWSANRSVVHTYSFVTDRNLPNIQALASMRYRMQEVNRNLLRASLLNTPEEAQKYNDNGEENRARFNEVVKKYMEVPFVPDEDALFTKTSQAWDNYLVKLRSTRQFTGQPENREQLLKLLDHEVSPARTALVEALDGLRNFHDNEVQKAKDEAISISRQAEVMIGACIVMGFLVALSIGFIFATS